MEKFNLISELKINKEAKASTDNPTLAKLSFIFTDDQPNGNKKGIPQTAFKNIVKTGMLMPIKMAEGEIAIDHTGAIPLGVISSLSELKSPENINQVVGEAVLWESERPNDVGLIKQEFASGNKVNVSWEILYSESSTDSNGTEWLLDPIVQAATFVGLPAYLGRTHVLDLSALNLPNDHYLYIEPSKDNDGKKYFPYKDQDGNIVVKWLQSALEEINSSTLSEDIKSGLISKVNEMLQDESAVWTTAYINDLPDSAFLYIEPGGTKDSDGKTTPRSLRHWPYKDASGKVDLPHVRDALSRIPQTKGVSDAAKESAKKRAQGILAKQKGNSSMDEQELKDKIADLETKLADAETKLAEKDQEMQVKDTELSSLKDYKKGIETKEAEAALLKTRLEAFATAGIEFKPEEIDAKKAIWLKMDEEQFNFLVDELKSRKPASSSLDNKVPDRLSQPDSKDYVEIVRNGLKEMNKK